MEINGTQVSKLSGMRDITGQEHVRLTAAGDSIKAYLAGRGYEVIDTPLLEEAELFARKSGGELSSRLYSFVDPGGNRVSLRPEFTSSVIRHFVQEAGALVTPVRWQYGGPVFRYEPDAESAYRQYTQTGAELIGAGGVEADAEVLSLAWAGLGKAGLQDYQMRIGHLGVLNDFLGGFGLSERANMFVIGNVQALKGAPTDVSRLMQQAQDMGLRSAGAQSDQDGDGGDMGSDVGREFVQGVLAEAMSSPTGRRTADQIVERLLRKMRQADDPERLESALAMVAELVQIEGSPATALSSAQSIVSSHGVDTSALSGLEQLFAALADKGISGDRIVLDLGYARGIAYYSGVIFGLTYPGLSGDGVLGGGGRYDGLVKALGGVATPALGFAYGLDRVLDAIAVQDGVGGRTTTDASSPG